VLRKPLVIAAVATLSATSCLGGKSLPEVKTALQERAVVDMGCPAESIQVKPISEVSDDNVTEAAIEISGCGGTQIASVSYYGSFAWSTATDWPLRKKLKFTYADRCPDWTVEYVDKSTRGVTACGDKLVYVLTPSGWLADTVSEAGDKPK
jgi:hypothetical protein